MLVDYNGLNLADDINYVLTGLTGWQGLPDITNGSSPRPRRNGSVRGGLLAQKRVIGVDLVIPGVLDDSNQTTKPKAALVAAMGLLDQEVPLTIDLGYGSRPEMAFVRVTAFDMAMQAGYGRNQPATIEFTATDPRRYSLDIHTSSTGLSTRAPGIAYPLTYPIHFTALGSPGSVDIPNVGNAETPATYTITGPINYPSITVVSPQGRFKTTFDLAVGAGEQLTVNSDTGEVKLNGSSRYGKARGSLTENLNLAPGVSTVTFGGQGDSSARLSIQWRDANI